MHLIMSIVLGAFVGWLAGKVMGDEGSLLRNIIVGMLGSFVGSLLFGLVGLGANGIIGSLIVSLVGACLCLWLAKKFLK